MKIAVIGAGAVGGYIGARLWSSGADVTFIDRGAQLAAIQANGLHAIGVDGTHLHAIPVTVAESPAKAGKQDIVLLAVKAHQINDVTQHIARSLS